MGVHAYGKGFLVPNAGVMRVFMNVRKVDEVWEAVLGELQLQVTRPSFETWLKDTVGLSHEGGEFVVGAPSTFVAEMLEQRMYSLISRAVERTVHSGVEVRFQVMSNGQAVGAPGGKADYATQVAVQPAASTSDRGTDRQPRTPSGDHYLSAGPAPEYRPVTMNPRYTFASFIVGKSNELAHAAAQAVSDKPSLTYNPLFIYSGVGLGKTHLLHAIGHELASRGMSLIYATTEDFTNDYIRAIREGQTEEFRGRYRSADILLLDDIQFIIGKEQTQEGFFHTFNSLHMAARQIVITSDRPVTALTLLEDRVRSRLAAGLVVDIQSPDLETRLAILRAKADETGQTFPVEVLQFLAERIHSNIRELEGCLNRLAAYAHLTAGPITLELVKNIVSDILHPATSRRVSEQAVIDAVSSYLSISEDAIKGRRRDKQTALARQITMYLLRDESNLSLSAIGRVLGGKDHTTVLHACQRITNQLPVDAHLRRDVLNIRGTLSTS